MFFGLVINGLFLSKSTQNQNHWICRCSVLRYTLHLNSSLQCLGNYTGTSAFADVSYLMADVAAIFFHITKMLLLADFDEYSLENAVTARRAWIYNYIPHILWHVITYPCPRYLLQALISCGGCCLYTISAVISIYRQTSNISGT